MIKFHGGAVAKIAVLGCAFILMLCMAGCSSSEDRYLDTLESAQDKFYSATVEREKRYPNYTLIGYYTGFAIRFAA